MPSRPSADHRVYAILLGGLGSKRNRYCIYVGETSVEPELRLLQHLTGARSKKDRRLASGPVRLHGIELLPTVIGSLAQVEKAVAKEVERGVADALRRARIAVEGGT